MSRRQSGRSRRWIVGPSGIYVPAPVLSYNLQAANVTKDGSNLLSQVNDLSSNGYHVTSSGGNRPLWVSQDFDTNGDGMSSTTTTAMRLSKTSGVSPVFGAAGYTVFVVTRYTSSGSGTHSVFYHNNASLRGGWFLGWLSTNTRYFQANTLGGTTKTVTFGTTSLGTDEIWCIRNVGASDDSASTTFEARVNGAVVAHSGNPWFAYGFGTPVVFLGPAAATGGPEIHIGAARAYNEVLTTAQVQAVERELAATYGITLP